VLFFRCLTYSSREITTTVETATAIKAKDVNSEAMLLSVESVSVGVAVSNGVGFGVRFELAGIVVVCVLLQALD